MTSFVSKNGNHFLKMSRFKISWDYLLFFITPKNLRRKKEIRLFTFLILSNNPCSPPLRPMKDFEVQSRKKNRQRPAVTLQFNNKLRWQLIKKKPTQCIDMRITLNVGFDFSKKDCHFCHIFRLTTCLLELSRKCPEALPWIKANQLWSRVVSSLASWYKSKGRASSLCLFRSSCSRSHRLNFIIREQPKDNEIKIIKRFLEKTTT